MSARRDRVPGAPVTPVVAGLLDGVLVLGFAALGRASHDRGDPVTAAALTAWPFLAGAALGWVLVRWRSGRWPLAVGPGATVWGCAVAGGMALRAVFGQGTALPFVLVATGALGVLLLGWRWLAGQLPRAAGAATFPGQGDGA